MFRVALIAYLSTTTVLGPLLCCCNAQQLFTMVEVSKCCGKSGRVHSNAKDSEHAAHDHHHGHAHHHHEHSPVEHTSKTDPAPTHDEHDGQNCPCGKHHASLVAVAVTDGVQLKAVELQSQTWLIVVALLPLLSDFDADYASMIAQNRPADLYGREILRAYQIMRC